MHHRTTIAAAIATIVAIPGKAVTRGILCVAGACAAAAEIDEAPAPPALFAPGLVSTGHDESHPAFTPEGKTLYFLRNRPDFAHWTILQAGRTADGWSEPVVAPFSGRWSDADVFVTRDGESLFFVSMRPVEGDPKQDTDIWRMPRMPDGWGAPVHVQELSSDGFEWFPTLTDDGTIYFGSERPGGFGKTDLWRAEWRDGRFGEPVNLGPAINTAEQEIEPLIDREERWLIFAARREGNKAGQSIGDYDLYVSWNCPGGWSVPTLLPGEINSTGWDFAPRFTPDGSSFLFASNRADDWSNLPGPMDAETLERRLDSPRNGLRDIYIADAAYLQLETPCRQSDGDR